MPWGLGLGQAFVPIEYVPMIVPVGEIFVTLLPILFAVHILVPSKAISIGSLSVPENVVVAPDGEIFVTLLPPLFAIHILVPSKAIL